MSRNAILARMVPLLAATILAGCAADRVAERRAAEPKLLPFTYAPRSDGAVNAGVRSILQDREGHYWFGSDVEGVCRVDGENVRQFTTAHGLSNDQVRSIQEAPDGSIWFDTGVGVIVVDGDSVAGLTPLAGTADVLLRMGAPITATADANRDESLQRVFSIGEDHDGNIWIGTIGGGAWRYDGRELRQFTASDGLTTANVMAISCNRDGTLWLGGTGVFRLNGQRFERVH